MPNQQSLVRLMSCNFPIFFRRLRSRMTGLTIAFIAAVTLTFTTTAAGEPPLDLENAARHTLVGEGDIAMETPWQWLAQVMVCRVPSAFHVMPEQIDLDTCGGIVVHTRWIATAAHCISKGVVATDAVSSTWKVHDENTRTRLLELQPASPEELFTMVLGVIRQEPVFYKYRDQWELSPQIYDVEEVVVHPGYNSMDNDIVLLRVMEDMLAPDLKAANWLPLSTDIKFPEEAVPCRAFGWGCTAPGKKTAKILQQMTQPIVSSDICTTVTGLKHMQDKICAGFIMNYTGLCEGDSGWPLVCKKGDRWITAGLASMGFLKPVALPVIFTRLSHYMGWIIDVVDQPDRNNTK